MAELENEQEIETTDVDVNEEVNDTDDVEDTQDESEDITYEQALDWKKQLQEKEDKIKELWDKIYAHKKAKKVAPKNTEDVRAILAEEKFYDKNPEAESYRKDIEKYVKKWIERDEAMILVTRKDKEVEKTREVYWDSMIGTSDTSGGVSVVTTEQFDSMTPEAQDEYTQKTTSKFWGVKFK